MYLPLRAKFAIVAGTVAIIALGTALWALSYRLERQMAGRIGDVLISAETTFTHWERERQNYLRIQARTIARDPRFFAAIADGDAATALPAAWRFQTVVGSSLFLVCDGEGRLLAHLTAAGEIHTLDWPATVPPAEEYVCQDGELHLLQTRAVTVGPDTVGYVALGDRVDAGLATTVGQIAGVDVIFFDDQHVFGSSMTQSAAQEFVQRISEDSHQPAKRSRPVQITLNRERFLYRTGEMIGGGGSFYAVVVSLDNRLEPLIADTRGTLTVVGAIALVLAFLISWVVARKITARVPLLVHSVEAVAKGDYSRSVVHRGHDEFHTLAQAVDRMRTALAAQMEAIRRANAERIAAERLAIIGKMASTIIHDFKTPMQVIRSAVELTSVAELPAAKRSEYAGMVTRELDRMVDMAQELLAYARGDRRMARTEVVLDEFLADAVQSWQQIAAQQSVHVEHVPGASRVTVAIDRDKVHRALNNIVTNALEVLTTDGRIVVRSTSDHDTVIIRISDTGPGIPDEIRDTIFEPFATFGKAQGTGLGLAMAKKTVDDHQGTIEVTSGPGTGTCFTITLPRASQAPLHDTSEKDRSHVVAMG